MKKDGTDYILCLIALLLAWSIYSFRNYHRYELASSGSNDITILDTRTGNFYIINSKGEFRGTFHRD